MTKHALVEAVMGELGDLVDALDRFGADYVRRLVTALVDGSGRTPAKPRDLHPLLAAAVRDVVMETAQARLGALPVRFR